MPIDNPKYDVAISFLAKDEGLARDIHRLLSQGLDIFFFPRNQETLAGTNGLESMRSPFYDDSRLIVVLYREPWGETEWTRVESTAIQESFLKFGWHRLFFIALDRKSKLPDWLPSQAVRFNIEDYGVDQAAGAIKNRVEEFGGRYQPMTPAKRAAILNADEEYRRKLSSIRYEDVVENVRNLFTSIKAQSDDLSTNHGLGIDCEVRLSANHGEQACMLRCDTVAVGIHWLQRYSNALADAVLIMRELNGRILFNSELGMRMVLTGPEVIKETRYLPYLSRSLEHGWKRERSEDFISNQAFAERCVMKIMDLIDARGSGKLKAPQPKRGLPEGFSEWA
jgi:hypothetical protein